MTCWIAQDPARPALLLDSQAGPARLRFLARLDDPAICRSLPGRCGIRLRSRIRHRRGGHQGLQLLRPDVIVFGVSLLAPSAHGYGILSQSFCALGIRRNRCILKLRSCDATLCRRLGRRPRLRHRRLYRRLRNRLWLRPRGLGGRLLQRRHHGRFVRRRHEPGSQTAFREKCYPRDDTNAEQDEGEDRTPPTWDLVDRSRAARRFQLVIQRQDIVPASHLMLFAFGKGTL